MCHLLLLLVGVCWCIGVVHGDATVHLVPHSHCDAGFRLSFEEYYQNNVHSILDSVLVALTENESRRFVWEEVSFLSRWWQDASVSQKETMIKLMNEKRLEFIGGGWVMHDEAVTDAFTILTQMTLGLKYLNDTLNTRPKYEWHIDPFGHSLMMPELYSALQYKAIVLNRIPDQIKQDMKNNRSLEFYWKSPYSNEVMFTHVLGEHYSTPVMLGVNPVQKAESLVEIIKKRLKWSRTDHLLVPFGNDFAFDNASVTFELMETVVNYINSHRDKFGLVIQFSTLDEYFSVVMNSKTDFPTINGGDFFPYIACYFCFSEKCGMEGGVPCSHMYTDAFWSGFYTSKPIQKLLVREQETVTFSLNTLNALVYEISEKIEDTLTLSKNTTSLLAHHDAITGTSFPPSYDDYNKRLTNALSVGEEALAKLKEEALCQSKFSDLSTNVIDSLSRLTDGNMAVVVLFNPSGQTRAMYTVLELPSGLCVEVLNKDRTTLTSQIVGNRLYIPIEIEVFGLKVVYLKKAPCTTRKNNDNININNGFIKLGFNDDNQLTSWTNLQKNEKTKMTLNFTHYLESEFILPHSVCDGSNVYTFIPDDGSKVLVMENKTLLSEQTASGPLVWEIQQQIETKVCPINVTIRSFKPINDNDIYKEFIEILPKIGPLPISHPNSISMTLGTDLATGSDFTTYTNGIYPMLRTYKDSVPLQGNFYPLVGRASIVDKETEKGLIIATKRPVGVTANKGMMQILSHRRIILSYDQRGNDGSTVNDTMLVGLTSYQVSNVSWKAMEQSQHPFSVHIGIIDNIDSWTSLCDDSWTPFVRSLPQNIHLVSLELLKGLSNENSLQIGIRLINSQSTSIDVNIAGLLDHWNIVEMNQTTPDFGITTQTITTGGQVTLLSMKLTSYSMLIGPSAK